MDSLRQDLRFAIRSIASRPGFAAAVVATIGLAVGGNAMVFTLVHGILLRPLPFAEPDRLVAVGLRNDAAGIEGEDLSEPDGRDLRARVAGLAELVQVYGQAVVLDATDHPLRLRGARVNPALFDLLGVGAARGRTFTAAEGEPGGERVVVLGEDLARRLGPAASAPGAVVRLDGEAVTVVGVMPRGFRFPEAADLWLPLVRDPEADRSDRFYDLTLARLPPGIGLGELAADLDTASRALAAEEPGTNAGWAFYAVPLREALVNEETRRMLGLMMGAVGFLLLIACANVANLLLARETSRRREMAIRRALGAGGGRLVRQLLAESLVLAAGGGALGTLGAVWAIDLLLASNPEPMAYWQRFELGPGVLAFNIGVTLTAAFLFGILPALRSARTDPLSELKQGGAGAGVGRSRRRLQRLLVIAEMALSVVLLFGAALLVQSFLAMQHADPGFETDRLLSVRTRLAGPGLGSFEERSAFLADLIGRLEALPGVERVAASGALPIDDGGAETVLIAADRPVPAGRELPVSYVGSTEGFFDTLAAPLLAGRRLTATEVANHESDVAIVNRALAERLWGDEDPVGRRVRLGAEDDFLWLTVVGVAPDLQYEEFGEETTASRHQVHIPWAVAGWRDTVLLVRTAGDPASLSDSVRRVCERAAPSLAFWDLRTLDQVRRETTWGQRLAGTVFGWFAAVAILLTALGLYGVVAHAVGDRRHEIGVRLALGADRPRVVRQFLSEGLIQAGLGLAVGLVEVVLVSRLLVGLLYGVTATDPLTLALAPLGLFGIAIAATWLPARRAAAVEPSTALRAT